MLGYLGLNSLIFQSPRGVEKSLIWVETGYVGVNRYTERVMGIYFKSRKMLGTELYLTGLRDQ